MAFAIFYAIAFIKRIFRRVAGLNAAKAQEIINYRENKGAFQSREDLKKIKGIKEKTFVQCAGFVRVVASTAITG